MRRDLKESHRCDNRSNLQQYEDQKQLLRTFLVLCPINEVPSPILLKQLYCHR